MSFSMAAPGGTDSLLLYGSSEQQSKKHYKPSIVTLQVRIPFFIHAVCLGCHGKKASLSAPASMTLEAVLALSLFVFASVSLLLPMKILNTDRKIQTALEAVGEDFSRYAYLQDALEMGRLDQIPGADAFAKSFCKNLGSAVAAGYLYAKVLEYADTGSLERLSVLDSSFREDGEWFELVAHYEIRMPFPVLGLGRVPRTARCRRRAWIGKPGTDGEGAASGGDADDEIVYVGKGSTRYHRDRNCHYLSNDLKGVTLEQIENLRNQSGGRYAPCSVCGPGHPGQTVYIMPSGSSYHTDADCRAIRAYVRAVKLSEVGYLGPCSYCSQ